MTCNSCIIKVMSIINPCDKKKKKICQITRCNLNKMWKILSQMAPLAQSRNVKFKNNNNNNKLKNKK